MSRLNLPKIVVLSAALVLVAQQSLNAASPGPDETAESKSYDVTTTSNTLAELTGSFTFVGDPDRPQRSESGDFQASLAPTDGSTPGDSGTGTWWSRSFWFFSFWLAQADSAETDFRSFAIGVVWNSDLYGTVYVYGGTDPAQGRYRLHATVAAEPAPTAPTDGSSTDGGSTDGGSTDGGSTDTGSTDTTTK